MCWLVLICCFSNSAETDNFYGDCMGKVRMGFEASEGNIDCVRRREIELIESCSLSDEHEKFLKDVCNKALSRFANVKVKYNKSLINTDASVMRHAIRNYGLLSHMAIYFMLTNRRVFLRPIKNNPDVIDSDLIMYNVILKQTRNFSKSKAIEAGRLMLNIFSQEVP